MSYCPRCGAYIPIGETACPACGYDPKAEERAREEAKRREEEQKSQREREEKAQRERREQEAKEAARREEAERERARREAEARKPKHTEYFAVTRRRSTKAFRPKRGNKNTEWSGTQASEPARSTAF